MITRYIKSPFWYGVGDTITGQVRKANEDNCGYQKTPNGELFVVCDGMGGHVGGATASRIAVDSIISYMSQQTWPNKPLALENALRFANTQILGTAANDPSLKGMGTTACIVLCDGENVWIGHVGDSRIYLYEDKGKYLHRISKDHSYVQALVDKGELDDREAENHPNKNIIMRALGSKEEVEPDVEHIPLHIAVGDTFLICSDGLCGMIDDNEIETILSSKLSLEDKAEKLINEANAPDKGKDNITVQLIQAMSSTVAASSFPDFNPKWRIEAREYPTRQRRKRIMSIAICVAVLLLMTICGVLTYIYKGDIKQYLAEKVKKVMVVNNNSDPKEQHRDAIARVDEDLDERLDALRSIGTGKIAKTVDQIEAEADAYLKKIRAYGTLIDNEKKAIEELDTKTKGLANGISKKDMTMTTDALDEAEKNLKNANNKLKSIADSIAVANAKLEALKRTTNKTQTKKAGADAIADYNQIKKNLEETNLMSIKQSIEKIRNRKNELERAPKGSNEATVASSPDGINLATPSSTDQVQEHIQSEEDATSADGSSSTNVHSTACELEKGKQRKFTDKEFWGLSSKESKSTEWTSSNEDVVEIKKSGDKGFEGKALGNATIIGKKDGQEKYKIEVTVVEK